MKSRRHERTKLFYCQACLGAPHLQMWSTKFQT
jgi:hypothetical protein